MSFSQFGDKFTQHSGISRLMEDMGAGLRTPGTIMLGGGNPAQIPAMNDYFQQPISAQNIELTNGSQSAFFYLFNLFAGRRADGSKKRVLFPLAPEYLGYADAGLEEGLFVSAKPNIELLPEGQFKYHVDFEHLPMNEEVGLICVSRPTNPTGNVITDDELMQLPRSGHNRSSVAHSCHRSSPETRQAREIRWTPMSRRCCWRNCQQAREWARRPLPRHPGGPLQGSTPGGGLPHRRP